MLAYIKETCAKIIETSGTFRADLISKIVRFAFPPLEKDSEGKEKRVSTRTQDVVKSIPVFVAQFLALLDINNFTGLIENEEHQKLFVDPQQLHEMKRRVIRSAAEEILRRHVNRDGEQVVAKVTDYLYEGHQAFIDKVFARREVEINELTNPKEDAADAFTKYEKLAFELKE